MMNYEYSLRLVAMPAHKTQLLKLFRVSHRLSVKALTNGFKSLEGKSMTFVFTDRHQTYLISLSLCILKLHGICMTL